MASRRSVFLGLALLSSVLARSAQSAEATAQEKETARAMMDAGHARRAAGDHVGALEQFGGADAIMHVPTTGLETAREQASLGRLVEARDTLQRVIRSPLGGEEPEVFRAARKSAEALDDEVSKRIPALRIAIRGASSDARMLVTVDDLRIPTVALVAPFKVNPGHHVVTAATGAATAHAELDVVESETAPVTVTFPPSPSSDVVPAARPDETANPTGETTQPPGFVPWLRWGGFGLGIMGVVVGSVTGVMSISTTNSLGKTCVNGRCPPNASRDLDSARTTAMISNVSFAAAGVGCALGIISFVIGGSPASSGHTASSGARVVPWIGPDGPGISGRF